MGNRNSGRHTPLSRLMDATGLVLDLREWDRREQLLLADAQRRSKRSGDVTLMGELQALMHGDAAENNRHQHLLEDLRAANGALDIASEVA